MSRLTLNVDERDIARAKQYARRHGISISELVETVLDPMARPAGTGRLRRYSTGRAAR